MAGDELFAVVSGVYEAFMREAGPLPVGRFSQAEGHSGSFGGLCLLHRAEHPTCAAARRLKSSPDTQAGHAGSATHALLASIARNRTVRCAQAGTLCTLSRHALRAALVSDAERRHDAECRSLRRALAVRRTPTLAP